MLDFKHDNCINDEACMLSKEEHTELEEEVILLLNVRDNASKQQFLDTWSIRVNRLRRLISI